MCCSNHELHFHRFNTYQGFSFFYNLTFLNKTFYHCPWHRWFHKICYEQWFRSWTFISNRFLSQNFIINLLSFFIKQTNFSKRICFWGRLNYKLKLTLWVQCSHYKLAFVFRIHLNFYIFNNRFWKLVCFMFTDICRKFIVIMIFYQYFLLLFFFILNLNSSVCIILAINSKIIIYIPWTLNFLFILF